MSEIDHKELSGVLFKALSQLVFMGQNLEKEIDNPEGDGPSDKTYNDFCAALYIAEIVRKRHFDQMFMEAVQ